MKASIYEMIKEIFNNLETNNLAVVGEPEIPAWDEPIMGVAAGDDEYFKFLKEHIGEFHLSPSEVFSLKFDESIASKLRVISIVFPHSETILTAQSRQSRFLDKYWAAARGTWEQVVKEFASKLETELNTKGIRAVSVDLRPEVKRENSETLGICSTWSHRHAAFAAGLGTFGLSDGFITEKGKAVRFMSFIVEADLEPTEKDYEGHYDWCLYFRSGICGACIRRCPKRAIAEKGHDKEKCFEYTRTCYEKLSEEIDTTEMIEVGCGLCQTKVPCMNKKP